MVLVVIVVTLLFEKLTARTRALVERTANNEDIGECEEGSEDEEAKDAPRVIDPTSSAKEQSGAQARALLGRNSNTSNAVSALNASVHG